MPEQVISLLGIKRPRIHGGMLSGDAWQDDRLHHNSSQTSELKWPPIKTNVHGYLFQYFKSIFSVCTTMQH